MSSQDYAEMIEIPVSSCEMVSTPQVKKSRKNNKIVKKFNKKIRALFTPKKKTESSYEPEPTTNSSVEYTQDITKALTVKESGHRLNLITVQVATIFILAIGILVTNIFWQDSGINNLLRSVFASEKVEVDQRNYDVFDAFAPSKNEVKLTSGIMKIQNKGAVYSPCDGFISEVTYNGKYTITVSHSDNYKTIIYGADYCYIQEGDNVFLSTPVAYSLEGGCEVAMYNQNQLITNYALDNGKIVWQN